MYSDCVTLTFIDKNLWMHTNTGYMQQSICIPPYIWISNDKDTTFGQFFAQSSSSMQQVHLKPWGWFIDEDVGCYDATGTTAEWVSSAYYPSTLSLKAKHTTAFWWPLYSRLISPVSTHHRRARLSEEAENI